MNRPNLPHRRPHGFTLVELLAVLAILSVLAAVGVPSLARAGDSMKLATFTTELLAHLHLARSESIKRRTRVVLCKSADGEHCVASGGWEQGWIVFQDSDGDGSRQDGEAVVARMPALPGGWIVEGNATVSRYISYDPTGTTRLAGGGFQAGTFTLCRVSEGPTAARQIVLNIAGRPRLASTTVNHCS